MTIQAVAFEAPVSYAIAEGATIPNPGVVGVTVWSTSLNKLVVWNGSTWNAVGAVAGGTTSVDYVLVPSSIALTIGAGWVTDNNSPDGAARLYNTVNNSVITFVCANTTQLVFTLIKDWGWGAANIVIDGVTQGVLTSFDDLGGPFLQDVAVPVYVGNVPKIVSIVGLLASAPIVFTKIAFTSVSSATAGLATGAVEVDFGTTPQDQARTTVVAPSTTAASQVLLTLSSVGTVDHSADEHAIECISLASDTLVVGVGFDILATCTDKFGLTGKWAVRWTLIG